MVNASDLLDLGFGKRWNDTAELLVLGLGPCAGCCGREYMRRYRWNGREHCVNHYYRARMETEWLAGWEADQREWLVRVGAGTRLAGGQGPLWSLR